MRLRPQVSFLQDHILNLIIIQTMYFFFSKEHKYRDYGIFLIQKESGHIQEITLNVFFHKYT